MKTIELRRKLMGWETKKITRKYMDSLKDSINHIKHLENIRALE